MGGYLDVFCRLNGGLSYVFTVHFMVLIIADPQTKNVTVAVLAATKADAGVES